MLIKARSTSRTIIRNMAVHQWAQMESDLQQYVKNGDSMFSVYVQEDDGEYRFFGVVDQYGYTSCH